MNKGSYVGLQVAGMVVTVVFAQAALRQLFDHEKSQLWGVFDWIPGGWSVRFVALLLVTAVGVLLAGWANDKVKQHDE
ncbi:hypothetical protein [Nocardia mexicana]|uniref:Uncharacterized protein n=1 Tax=Nocardia mexicana TaxID=279262 RepID=A0A370GL57_9NOCA|nr:hypothetical protein [Nocardia mexicana]RDI44502.1 hypothetical protein DFR68_117119 [Nocardia mexicana]